MYQLINFLYKFRAFILFIVLESLCVVFIYQTNSYQRAGLLNSSNWLTGNILSASDYLFEFISLRQANMALLEENARLNEKEKSGNGPGTIYNAEGMEFTGNFEYIEADVINNSTFNFNNFITINKGRNNGIGPGMGVVSSNGIVGKINAVSDNFSVAYSLLHSKMMVSARISSSGDICTVKWDGLDPLKARVMYLPRHLKLETEDKVYTSGYNAVFPSGVLIGVIDHIELRDDSMFYDVTIRLATGFSNLSYVYVIKNYDKMEIDSLEQSINLE